MEDTTYFPVCPETISNTSFLMINCYSLIIASFIAMVIFILRGGSTALWSSFLRHDVSNPGSFKFMFIELPSLVLRNKSHPCFLVGGCAGPFLQFKCTSCMVRTISQNICITKNSYASWNYLSNTTFIQISWKLSRFLPSLPWHHWDCALIQYVSKEVSF